MNKNGELAESIKTAGGIILGIVALFIVLNILVPLFGLIFFDSGPDNETKESFNSLGEYLKKESIDGDFIFRFSKGWSLVIFEGGKGSSSSGSVNYYRRPPTCFNETCVILCKDKNDKDACFYSDYVIKTDKDLFTESNNGIVYPETVGKSRKEFGLLIFEESGERVKINFEVK